MALTDIPDAFEEEGFVGGLAHTGAAVTNAVAAFGTSAIESVATGGAGLAVDMVSSSVRDYARARAEEEGVSIEEAAANLGAETIIPVGLGALSYSFERAGIKGVASAIKGMAPSAKKALFNVINASGKEGMTELAQGVVESFNQGFAGKRSLDEAAENVGEFWREEALETFLQGAVGGGVSAGGGRSVTKAASTIRSRAAEEVIKKTTEDIAALDQELNNPELSKDEKRILRKSRTALVNKLHGAVKEPNKDITKLNNKQIKEVNNRRDNITKLKKELDSIENLPEETQTIVKQQTEEKIQKEIDGINKVLENKAPKNVRLPDGREIQQPDTKKKLRVFDFDDTLFSSENVVKVKGPAGDKTLTSDEFASYQAQEGETLDFSDFANARNPNTVSYTHLTLPTIYSV